MSGSADDLHGNVPSRCPVTLLLIDVINDLEFPEGEQLLEHALPMAEALSRLCERARSAEIPIVYVNDNFGRWRSDFRAQVEHCLHDGVRGEPLVRLLQPQEQDYFVLKPKHSGFYSTGLDLLLETLGSRTLILTGLATNICVLFTASDAYIRNFQVIVPRDCCAANELNDHRQALELMEAILKAKTHLSEELDLDLLRRE